MATRFSGEGSRSTRREPPTMGKNLVSSLRKSNVCVDYYYIYISVNLTFSFWSHWMILSVSSANLILVNIGQCDVMLFFTWYIYRIVLDLKVEIHIIASIAVKPIWRAVIQKNVGHISNDNVSFPFCVYDFLSFITDKTSIGLDNI
jgi:hypothetical protein